MKPTLLLLIFISLFSLTNYAQVIKFDAVSQKFETIDTIQFKNKTRGQVYISIEDYLRDSSDVWISEVEFKRKADDILKFRHTVVLLYKDINFLKGIDVECRMHLYVNENHIQFYITDYKCYVNDYEYRFETTSDVLKKYNIFEAAEIQISLLKIFLQTILNN